MTARRPCRISADIPTDVPRDEDHARRRLLHTSDEDRWEGEAASAVQERVSSRLARNLPDDAVLPVLHPALTDYGPESAANFFRQIHRDSHSALKRPPTPARASRRSCNPEISQWKSADSPKRFPSIEQQYELPDLLEFSESESQCLSQTPDASKEVRSLWHHASQELLGSDENEMPPRRKGSKRARRARGRGELHNDKSPFQPQNIPHGAALLRTMRQRQARRFSQDGDSEHGPSLGEAQHLRQLTPTLRSYSTLAASPKPASALEENLMQHWPRQTEDEPTPGIIDVASVAHRQRSIDAVLMSTDSQRTPLQVPRAQSSRNSASSKPSRLSSPPRKMQISRPRILRESIFHALPGPGGQKKEEASGNESASSQKDLIIDHILTDVQPNIIPSAAPDLRKRIYRYHSEEPKLPVMGYFGEQQQKVSLPSAPATPLDGFSSPSSNAPKYQHIIPITSIQDFEPKRQLMSAQVTSPERRDRGVAAMQTNNRFVSGDSTIPTGLDFEPDALAIPLRASFEGQSRGTPRGWPDLPTEIYLEIARYLSRDDALNLRLVCRDFSIAMMGAVFGSVVVPFGKAMYNMNLSALDCNPPSRSMFESYGLAIRKFGISFEMDTDLMAKAQMKTHSNEESSWWGSYTWPTPVYPRFSHLHMLENLADNVSLLKSAMSHLGKTHELGLCIDSGHGWLNGPDISDMALFDVRCGNGTRVFGRNLPAEDKQKQATRVQLFEYAQARTLQECTQLLRTYNKLFGPHELAYMSSIVIRDLESFRSNGRQPDFDAAAHVGGAIPASSATFNTVQPPNAAHQPVGGPPQPPHGVVNTDLHHHGVADPLQQLAEGQNYNNLQIHPNEPHLHNAHLHAANLNNGMFPVPPTPPDVSGSDMSLGQNGQLHVACDPNGIQAGVTVLKEKPTMQPQYPLIFNGYNLSAEIGGWCHIIQKKVASPKSFPLQPGSLTEAQAQWLMETVWAQRAFLSAYITSILANRACFAQVQSLHIGKISSGLLPSLEQRELWQGLPGLTELTVLVSPDWRVEHITGDQSFNSNMLVSPADASLRLTEFLTSYIAPLEKLSKLTIGFIGGGEHASGIMARNQHVLPAPVSTAPRTWLSNHVTQPDPRTIITFNHIRHLTVQNAWFSPLMLEAFMRKSQDTSLRTLALNSVSLTATHGQRVVAPLTTATESLGPLHPPAMWLHETLPATHCWPATIDRITPGATFLEHQYDAGMIADTCTYPRPPATFRGYLSRLIFQSCGYVRISGVSIQDFNQNDLVYPNSDPMDAGLKARAAALAEKGVMLSDRNPSTGAEWPLLGKLTQCIHPIEKRVLEEAWGMKFGWDDDLERWGAVEDGCFESGTGRFSGVIVGEGGKGIGGDGE